MKRFRNDDLRPSRDARPSGPGRAPGPSRSPAPGRTRGLGGARLCAAAIAAVLLSASGANAAAADCADGGEDTRQTTRTAGQETTYYISLGDSLASGYQPGAGDTDVSYTDRLHEALQKREPGLEHIRLGCAGETTETLRDGGICEYPGGGSQLDAAVRALTEHRGKVAYVTLDIGANDTGGCVTGTGAIGQECLAAANETIAKNLAEATRALTRAGTEQVRYAGMTYYNPYLAAWLLGEEGQRTARDSAPLVAGVNGTISGTFEAAGFEVADVAGAYSSGDFENTVELPSAGEVPVNVGEICRLTWMCSEQDIHANPEGHRVIADAFTAVLPEVPPQEECPSPSPAPDPSPSGNTPDADSESRKPVPGEPLSPGAGGELADTGAPDSTPLIAGLAVAAIVLGGVTVLVVRRRTGPGRTEDED
ncbi:SGNH/GDSL hydrolase family protein [Streptomyces lycii]|uniref:SGNH/GDSL hydrolase family protein n=1 Tax=Streptomyces lycii TaxID=2654337 RepID=A0ABQ7FHM5_9ACTN|nr:SGNH/GDSL hydrolase family protein [Streptomyces lycii]KAF4407840.1 SGNH/GDSL hydrolase family protein [Streptomyces lycii]